MDDKSQGRKERPFAGLARDFDDLRARNAKGSRSSWVLRVIAAFFVVAVIIPVTWVLVYSVFEAPFTVLMAERAAGGAQVRHNPVPLASISPHLVRAVIAAEDSRFCTHNGFDVEAIQKAVKYNERARERGSGKRRGASTVSQQTAKNVFLWPQRSWVRKGLEVYYTVLIEALWSKKRIMQAYLNAAEWGDGLFGAEAAAQARFGKSAKDLSPSEAARLAAVLPSPNKWSVPSPGPYVRGRVRAIMARATVVRAGGFAGCVLDEKAISRPGRGKPKELPDLPPPPPELAPAEDEAPPSAQDVTPAMDGEATTPESVQASDMPAPDETQKNDTPPDPTATPP